MVGSSAARGSPFAIRADCLPLELEGAYDVDREFLEP